MCNIQCPSVTIGVKIVVVMSVGAVVLVIVAVCCHGGSLASLSCCYGRVVLYVVVCFGVAVVVATGVCANWFWFALLMSWIPLWTHCGRCLRP